MDLATLLGLVGAMAVIGLAIVLGGSAGTFMNVPSLAVVIGGTFAATLTRISLADFFGSFK
ncbi:MAG: flagellar motor protein PomA, partial [Gammaproteobacteria bacterium]|nr:flagellar motor protein PomA [Gammaproteobacteria bacterium]